MNAPRDAMDVLGQRANLSGQVAERGGESAIRSPDGLGEPHQLETDGGEPLAEHVVQLARQVLAVGLLRFDQPRRQIAELVLVLGFGALARGDVLQQSDEIVDGSVGGSLAACRHDAVDNPAVLANPPLVQRIAVDLAGHHAIELCEVRRQVGRIRQVGPLRLQQLGAVVAENAAQLLVDFENPLAGRGHRHANQAELEAAPEMIFTDARRPADDRQRVKCPDRRPMGS